MRKLIIVLLIFLVLPQAFAKTGSMKLLAVAQTGNKEQGSTADLQLEINSGTGRVFIDTFPLTKLDTQISTRFANEIACDFLGIECDKYDFFYTITSDSSIVGGPSAGAAITVLTISVLEDLPLNPQATITGTINSGGLIGPVGGIPEKVDAAAKFGLNKVLIPKWSQMNLSNISSLVKLHDLEIIRVSSLAEAVYEMTGKQFNDKKELVISSTYLETMKEISKELCSKTEKFAARVNTTNDDEVRELYQKGNSSLRANYYYSAASFCFGANVRYRYQDYLGRNLSEEEIGGLIDNLDQRLNDFQIKIQKKKLTTINDLQTFMIVSERIKDAQNYVSNARKPLNNTNETIYNLAFGTERLESAYSWATFFGTPGKKFRINKASLARSCLNKISEVEERMQYLQLYLPTPMQKTQKDLDNAYEDYNNGDHELCLFKASKAKAEADLVLNTLAINKGHMQSFIEERTAIVEQIIASQEKEGVFPIVGYSYFEYARSLKNTDPVSSLLYLEYSLELSKLDIYFQKTGFEFPNIDFDLIILFGSGGILGFALGVFTLALVRRKYYREL